MRSKSVVKVFHRIDPSKVSFVTAVITTTVVLAKNPWSLFWYPPITLVVGLLTFAVMNALLTCLEE